MLSIFTTGSAVGLGLVLSRRADRALVKARCRRWEPGEAATAWRCWWSPSLAASAHTEAA